MPDHLHPYTVSGVVDTISSEPTGTPSVHDGHVDFDDFVSGPPLAATEQFRWVHVWAPDRTAAVATEALTADLRPGGDLARPEARALTGEAGLKPYSVAAVRTRTGRAIGEPVVAEGHDALAGATLVGRWGTRGHTANVWALDRADAIAQVFGTNATASTVRPDSVETAREDRSGRGQVVPLDAAVVARHEWGRLAGMPAAARAALVAESVWNREYPAAHRRAYLAAAIRVETAATAAVTANPGAWLTLHRLAASAGDAISRLAPGQPVPPADRRTVGATQAAVESAVPQPPWQRVADISATGSRTAATLAGTLTATADILIGWRARGGPALAAGTIVAGKPAQGWVADLLAAVNRQIATAAVPVSGRTAAQLAREDQAPGVASSTVAAVSSRTRAAASPAPPSTTTRRTR